MSSLPPYSTYRTDNKQQVLYPQQLSHGNVLTFTPPGFRQTLNVKFPDCRLAVCEKCKKNYKTRDMCRVRNGHTTEPWTTAYICFTLDDNCTDENGKYIDKPLAVRMIQWQPFCVRKPFDPKTPVCSSCKKTNRTRSFCRERHKHRQLPWCTVYVLLSPADSIDPATRVAPESTPVENDTDNKEAADSVKSGDGEGGDVKATDGGKSNTLENSGSGPSTGVEATESPPVAPPSPKIISENSNEGDDINEIAESRTFLAKVSCKASSIHWLELAEYDPQDQMNVAGMHDAMMLRGAHGAPQMHMDPASHYSYPAHAFPGYHAQQHQYNLKSHQQYFFHMQQRHHHQYAAQQAAWQAQYSQQPPHMAGYTHHPAAPPPVSPQGPPATSPAGVTAGEAAAKASSSPAAPEQQGGSAPHAHAQVWQNHHMMYHQQMYQNQMAQFQQAGGVIPPQHRPPDSHGYGHPQGPPMAAPPRGEGEDDMEPAPVHALEDGGEHEAKRARLV